MVSVVTINYNNSGGLEKTIRSVAGQTYEALDFVIIDGGSSDKSVDVIKTYASDINYWVSEKDRGVYHAMNKGIAAAKGEYILFLNSGDYLADDDIISNVFQSHKVEKDIVYGDLYLKDRTGTISTKKYPDKLTFRYFFRNDSLPHPASFIKRSLFDSVGLYNEEFKIVSDWEFYVKAIFLFQATYAHIPIAISVFNLEGESSELSNKKVIDDEKEAVYSRYFQGIIDDYRRSEDLLNYFKSNIFLKIIRRMILSRHDL